MKLPRQRHDNSVWSAAYSADGSQIVTAGDDGTARVWEAESGAEVLTLIGHDGTAYSAAYSADGTMFVTAG